MPELLSRGHVKWQPSVMIIERSISLSFPFYNPETDIFSSMYVYMHSATFCRTSGLFFNVSDKEHIKEEKPCAMPDARGLFD